MIVEYIMANSIALVVLFMNEGGLAGERHHGRTVESEILS